MKTKAGAALMSLLLSIVAIAFLAAPARAADGDTSRLVPPGSQAYGKTLTEWLGIYWRWFYTGQDAAQSMVGRVKLLSLPEVGDPVSGTGTPDDPALYRGLLKITLRPGTPFVLPLAVWTVERYNDGTTPDDPGIADADFLAGVSPRLFIDGNLVVSNVNKRRFYVPLTAFDPIVVYPKPTPYNSYGALAYQGYGVVVPPLPVGTHIIHLYEPYIIRRPVSVGVIYDNTWVITVRPH